MTEANKGIIPLVSVIIPTYNRINTLPRSIGSVLNQTYENLELIVVDDGSTDGTEEYVKGLQDGRIRYVKGDGNRGPAAARNMGVRLAQGEYVAFQDSDDEWHLDKLEKQMVLLLDSELGNDMVYCEYTRYHKQIEREVVPSKKIPAGCKQGNILSVLLLQPLIGTPTIVVKKECFMQAGGFDERLKTFEDYEFTVRFSCQYHIGFVEEVLVKVYDLPNSIDKRYADRIRTQAYIVREMIEPLRKYSLLWEKLSAIQRVAEHLKCHDVFLEELQQLTDLFTTEQEREYVAELREKTEKSDAKQNQYRERAFESLVHVKQRLLETYVCVYRDGSVENVNLDTVLQQAWNSMVDCGKYFGISPALCNASAQVYKTPNSSSKLECLSLLTEVVKQVEDLEKWIEQQRIECNVCSSLFFKNESHKCPFCEAGDRERLLISFLQDLQPEAGEVLYVLQLMPSRLLNNYVLNRVDMQSEIIDLVTDDMFAQQGNAGEQYDILICPAFSEWTDQNDSIWRGVHRQMKSGGICLLPPPPDEEEQRYAKQLETLGFYINIIGENWFGREFYQTYGFDRHMFFWALTKDRALAEL